MPTYKTKLSGKRVSWYYSFELPVPGGRKQFKKGGYATQALAAEAESARRLLETAALKVPVVVELPKTLGDVLTEWLADRRAEWSPKTAARYEELAAYISADLRATPIADLEGKGGPLLLHREWKRLHASGGRHRKTKAARPLAAKTVRHVAGVVSSAFGWALLYGLVGRNPVTDSQPPPTKKRKGLALSSAQTQLLIDAANGQWQVFLETEAASGARRGEVLALRWADLQDGALTVARSLCQAKADLFFKCTKTESGERPIDLPERTLAALECHRREQNVYRAQFGPDYASASWPHQVEDNRIEQGPEKDLIFAQPDGTPLKPDSVSSKISLLCRKLKLPKGASLHTLRHSHGSVLIEEGESIPAVSERLGHANAGITMGVYAHTVNRKAGLGKRWEEAQEGKKQ